MVATNEGGKSKRKGRQMVAIPDHDLYERAKAKAAEKHMTLQDYVNATLLLDIEKAEFLKEFSPSLYLDHIGQETIFIRDAKKERTAEIALKDGRLICYLDERNDCEHVHFALALPEVGKLHLNLKHDHKKVTGTST